MSNSNYKSLFKATGLFGFVEIIRILLRIIVNKFASYYLGPVGMGLIGFIENTAQLIISLTNFGINFTGLREIASNRLSTNLKHSIKLVNLFSLSTGFLAAIVTILFSTFLSKKTFGTDEYTIWFILLSVYFVCTSYVQGKIIMLEGLQELKKLILLNSVSNIVNTVIIIGCYYFYNINGIIIAMILTSVINLFIFWKGSLKYRTNDVKLSNREIEIKFKYFAKSGGLLALNACIGLLGFYLIRIYLKPIDNGIVLGYYQAGNILMVSYVGIIFIGINKFYFPKLAQTLREKSKKTINRLVNNQLELCLLILMPAILFLYFCGDFLIQLLFSAQFLPVYEILIFGLIAIIIKGFNYIVGYMILSNNNFKQFFYINALSDILNTFLTILLYKYVGLYGIGLAILVNYLLSAVYTYYYVKINYRFKLNMQSKKILLYAAVTSIILSTSYFYLDQLWYRLLTSVFLITSLIYSSFKLDEYLLDKLLLKKIKTLFKK